MNLFMMILLALYGIASIITGISLWKRKPVIIDALRNQRITIVLSIVILPTIFFSGSSLFYSDSIHWAWSLVILVVFVVYLVWHLRKKERVISFFYFEKKEFVTQLESLLSQSNVPLPGKPDGMFSFFRQYFMKPKKLCLQVEYSKIFNRFTVRVYTQILPYHFDKRLLDTFFSLASNRETKKMPMACVYYLSFGISWVVLCIWLGILGL